MAKPPTLSSNVLENTSQEKSHSLKLRILLITLFEIITSNYASICSNTEILHFHRSTALHKHISRVWDLQISEIWETKCSEHKLSFQSNFIYNISIKVQEGRKVKGNVRDKVSNITERDSLDFRFYGSWQEDKNLLLW